ncbi:MAG TPA: hypothetical protein PLU10_09100, partial [Chitinophagaceae bacterium]|nr:hypothetical protein [Chitinophagaceae bacterium]
MKKLLLILLFATLCVSNQSIAQSYDDVYSNGSQFANDPSGNTSTSTNSPSSDAFNYSSANDEGTSQRSYSNYSDDDYVDYDDDDYYYTTRIRRFHRPFWIMSYYSSFYMDPYWWDWNYSYPSWSIGWGYPSWYNGYNNYGWGNSYFGYGNNWNYGCGWNNSYYNGWGYGNGYYGCGYGNGWNNGWNNGWGWNNGYYNGYYNGYNNGYYNGYWDGYYDGNGNRGTYKYGPRGTVNSNNNITITRPTRTRNMELNNSIRTIPTKQQMNGGGTRNQSLENGRNGIRATEIQTGDRTIRNNPSQQENNRTIDRSQRGRDGNSTPIDNSRQEITSPRNTQEIRDRQRDQQRSTERMN